MTLRRTALLAAVPAIAALALAAACSRKDEPKAPPSPPSVAATVAPTPPPAAPALEGFAHEAGIDYQGYYIPTEGMEPTVGHFKLMNLTIGAPSDFSQWEANKRMATYGPVLIEFADLSSPVQKNEMGGEAHSTLRILPDSYRMDGKTVSFRGHAEGLGEVTFEGTFEAKTLADSKATGYGDGVVLRGTLRIAGTDFANMAFTYFGGD